MTKLLTKVKDIPKTDPNKLYPFSLSISSSIFKHEPTLAWDIIQKQCHIYTNPNLDVDQINSLTSIYCVLLFQLKKIVLKLNQMQDSRQKYFSNKMQKLMAEPFIIRCYSDAAKQKSTNLDLNHKRKQLEQKLSIQNEKQTNHSLQHIIQNQNQKQKKLIEKIEEVIEEHQKKLENRLHLRSMKKMQISPIKKSSQDSMLSSTESRNPEAQTPSKSDLSMDEITSPSSLSSYTNSSSRPLSERVFNYKFSKINVEQQNSDDDSSEDEYQIQKRLRESLLQSGDDNKKDEKM